MTVVIDVLQDVDGRKSFRVSRVFPNAASAEAACQALARINPAGFEGVVIPPEAAPVVQPEGQAVPETGTSVPDAGIVVDEDDPPPGCATGVCGMD